MNFFERLAKLPGNTTPSWLRAAGFHDPTSGLPVDPTVGDRYVSTATANGWTLNCIYEWDGTTWIEHIPVDGDVMYLAIGGGYSGFFCMVEGVNMRLGADRWEPIIASKLTAFNKNFGTTGGTVCEADDSRLADARTPLEHTTRQLLMFNKSNMASGTDQYFGNMGSAHAATYGLPMIRAGSIVGAAYMFNVTGVTVAGTFEVSIRVNDGEKFKLTSGTVSGTGVVTDKVTQTEGTYTFAAGDFITVYIDFVSTCNIALTFPNVMVEIAT